MNSYHTEKRGLKTQLVHCTTHTLVTHVGIVYQVVSMSAELSEVCSVPSTSEPGWCLFFLSKSDIAGCRL